ncbi:hypothetical protein [Arthrobacter bambusae]|uniref:hypothetical protein n=1 Tax=Arthrobacter bambusae TaxID=1338426 RepID=UPI002782B88F|nr:hypothetical protein [Arthrobacter bambusae]MDQ0030177.1 hypothetical protein [Arthrobacter bambusae]MDQ0097859.1 hypothetical protein [Arthrobacter bambusae]
MADKRLWTQMDLGFTSNPKVQEVLAESAGAVVLYIHSVLTSCLHVTDGFAKEKVMVRASFASQADADLLASAGMWHRPGHDCNTCPAAVPIGEVYIHDFEEHNPMWTTRAAETRIEKATKAARARWAADSKPEDATEHATEHAASIGQASGEQCSEDAPAMPEKRREEKKIFSSSSTTAFDAFWAGYPRKVGKAAAQKAFAKALKFTDVETVMSGVEALRTEVAGKDQKFTPHAATWLNEGRWDDEPSGQLQIPVNSPWDPSFHRMQVEA